MFGCFFVYCFVLLRSCDLRLVSHYQLYQRMEGERLLGAQQQQMQRIMGSLAGPNLGSLGMQVFLFISSFSFFLSFFLSCFFIFAYIVANANALSQLEGPSVQSQAGLARAFPLMPSPNPGMALENDFVSVLSLFVSICILFLSNVNVSFLIVSVFSHTGPIFGPPLSQAPPQQGGPIFGPIAGQNPIQNPVPSQATQSTQQAGGPIFGPKLEAKTHKGEPEGLGMTFG
jgi:hypothetical protein